MEKISALHSDKAEDVATSSSFRQFKIEHFDLDLTVDFDKKSISGTETLRLRCIRDQQSEVLLDIHPSLTFQEVSFSRGCGEPEWEKAEFLTRDFTKYGTTLVVKFPSPWKTDERFQLAIKYAATDGPGVCWLSPGQTAGKVKPYVFTQGQAVLNRSFFPCFDTPAVKSTYSASVKVPAGFTAVMSANEREHRKEDNSFLFRMEKPIPSYLVALAVGELVSAEVGPRTRVWTEPSLLEAAKTEFDGVIEEFLSVGEKLFGPYVWGRYDVLFMPPSFPFGGMENPCLTFVTPCLLAGDRSLADVIVHEICHSWFGNLVTNANWGDFWLNEGFTMYAQRRVCRELYGEAYTCLEAATGRALLKQHMDNTGEDHPLNKLRVKIEPGVDPDDTYNETPYEKGFCFVSYLAHLVGDQSRFDAFLRAYVDKFKFCSVMSEDTLEFYLEYFPELKKKGVHQIKGLEFESWLTVPGWPLYLPDLSAGQSLMKPAEQLAEMWAQPCVDMAAIGKVDIKPWKTYQTVYFLEEVLGKSPLPEGNMKKLALQYSHIVESSNSELRLRWAQIIAKNQHQPGYQHIRNFLSSQGKQKYTLPVYRALWSGSEETRALASEIFSSTAHQLHVNVRNYVTKILT
ncbi:aminopeptidase B isoform X2 [Clupea harengus]|uniref:Aminopeptidase B n=1 Tax=Clupea harengus TaxID=7950 RepID=A0A6P8FE30_CLUHA|nr:aminopeptidase B isoform X1 [Clupea harengus]XP_031423789.1 aminopeptidase B isoform X2 [Clupea harengus]